MRKILPFLLSLLLLIGLGLAGCGGGGGGTTDPVRVTFTLPIGNPTTVTQGDIVVLEVQVAIISGGSAISRVIFTANGTEIGRVGASPYRLNWNTQGLAPGDYQVTATAYDNSNPAQSGTASITIKVAASSVVVSFTSPPAGARTVTQGATVALAASATAPSEIARVEFTDNGSLIGNATVPSGTIYGLNWNTSGLALGTHTILARAFDRSTPVRTGSATIVITLQAPAQPAPTVQIDSPTGGVVSWNMNVTASAQAQATGAKITKIDVTFGALTRTIAGTGAATLSGTVAFDTTAASDGSHDITAVATDTNGKTSSVTVTVTVANGTSPPPPPF